MKQYVFTIRDGGADGVPFYSERVTVSIENGESWDAETLKAFSDSVAHAVAVYFGTNRPHVTIETAGEPERVLP